jgi:hypothetical protein
MSPICQRCFDRLPFESIMEYCQQLWNLWTTMDPECKPENFPALIIAKSIEMEKSGVGQWQRHPMLDDENMYF